MTDLTKFDLLALWTSVAAVVIMSLTMPPLGLVDEDQEAEVGDFPEYNIDTDSWDIVGDFPQKPGTPTEGNLIYNEENGLVPGKSVIWIDRPKSSGTSLEIQNLTNTEGEVYVTVIDWDDTSANGRQALDRYSLNNSEGETIIHDNTTWTIEFDVQSVENYKQPDMGINVRYEILESEEDEGGIAGIPVIGTLYSAGAQLAGMLAFLGSIILWATGTVIEVALTTANTLFQAFIYLGDLTNWMMGTYQAIVSAGAAWSKMILIIPLLLMTLTVIKIVFVGLETLPFT